MDFYKLVDDCIVVVSAKDWVGPQRVDKSCIRESIISTVFLGTDHMDGMFETMVFNGPLDGFMMRVDTAEHARKLHKMVVDVLHNADWFQWYLNSESIRPKLINEISKFVPYQIGRNF